jgi:hypothetical protein
MLVAKNEAERKRGRSSSRSSASLGLEGQETSPKIEGAVEASLAVHTERGTTQHGEIVTFVSIGVKPFFV